MDEESIARVRARESNLCNQKKGQGLSHPCCKMQRMGCNTQTLHSNLLILVSFKVKFPGSFTLQVTKFTSSTITSSKEHTAVFEACVPLRHDP
jgi:hypothetical protein